MHRRFALYAWSVLAFHLAVILWGAFVRASGSGAGCGEHWPLCNGQIIPRAPINATIVEFSHRLSSGIALLSVVALVIWAFRLFPRGSAVRFAVSLTLVSTLIECAIGAALVLLRLVASNESLSRGLWLGAHLTNTLFLLAALCMTAWKATGIRRESVPFPGARRIVWISTVGFLVAAILGGFAALGDTLVGPTSLTESVKQDFSAFSNIFVRVRILHPIVAGSLGIWLLVIAFKTIVSEPMNAVTRRLSAAIVSLILTQFILGFADILLGTPIWLQLLHLLNADLLWVAFVLLASQLLPSEHFVPQQLPVGRFKYPEFGIVTHRPSR